jgi:predicted TIM-barrel fold metal-dependent hydrolase
VKTPEQRAADQAALTRYAERQVAETKRLFRANRAANLRRKIAHLHAHGWHTEARSLTDELAEWTEALAHDAEPEQTVTPQIESGLLTIEIPDDDGT